MSRDSSSSASSTGCAVPARRPTQSRGRWLLCGRNQARLQHPGPTRNAPGGSTADPAATTAFALNAPNRRRRHEAPHQCSHQGGQDGAAGTDERTGNNQQHVAQDIAAGSHRQAGEGVHQLRRRPTSTCPGLYAEYVPLERRSSPTGARRRIGPSRRLDRPTDPVWRISAGRPRLVVRARPCASPPSATSTGADPLPAPRQRCERQLESYDNDPAPIPSTKSPGPTGHKGLA
jgi:hypothetical protein